jgi:calcium-dependent protein kinase
MGNNVFPCCNNSTVSYNTKIFKETQEPDNSQMHTRSKSIKRDTLRKNYTKKSTVYFDKSNFINMKTKSLFDDYDIVGKLGEGSYGAVYKAQHKKANLIRAIKAIKRKHIDGISFNNEITILKSVDHANIIKLFECYYDTNYYYLAEEFCPGGDLYDYIKKQKFFSEKKAAFIIEQLLSAMNHLHSKKIVHRDLKPENIVFYESNNEVMIKLIDFGTSIYINNEYLTQELGTIYYIAPEVFKNYYNEKADIWSIGIILYTMLCGHPPFRGNKEDEIKKKILSGKVEYLPKDFDKVSKEAIEFVSELLNYTPNKRPSCEEALNSKWIIKLLRTDFTQDNILDNKIVQNLIRFQSVISLQKASLAFIANQLGHNEEVKKIKDEFDKIDINKDGILSKKELLDCTIYLKLGMSKLYPLGEAEKKVAEVLDEVDFNNDGTISFSEFLTVTIKKEKLLSEESLKKAFDLFDIVKHNLNRMGMVI